MPCPICRSSVEAVLSHNESLQSENARLRQQVEQLAGLVRDALDRLWDGDASEEVKQRLDAIVGKGE